MQLISSALGGGTATGGKEDQLKKGLRIDKWGWEMINDKGEWEMRNDKGGCKLIKGGEKW